MQASEPQAVAPAILFFLAVALVFVCNAFLLHGSSAFARSPSTTDKKAMEKESPKKNIVSNIIAKKSSQHATKYRNMLWPGRRSISMSPSCGSLSKRLRSRSGSFSGTVAALGVTAPAGLDGSANLRVVKSTTAAEKITNWKGACSQWLQWDPNPTTRAVVDGWMCSGDEQSATKLLMGKRLAFGTSGLRGPMGAGYGSMNDLVIIQTTQGLCRYLEREGGEEFKKRGVVIGRDHRAQVGVSSEGFAKLAAAVFVSRGFKVYLLSSTVATPLVAFGVSHLKACGGVMITASHNPKMDNGYKVYWGNGSQIIPPHDKGIAASIRDNLEPWQVYKASSAMASPRCSDPLETLAAAYFHEIGDKLCRRPKANAHSGLQVVYSAMHGVGDQWAKRAFKAFSLPPFLSVESQRLPDPEFPTVIYPNPEEPGALKEAIRMAEEKGASVVLANDPDADRLAAAERQPSGEWYVFSGNEIGILLGTWQWDEWRRTHPNDDPSKAVMIASTVSSKMLSAVAKYEGFRFEETLPGFKWMGHRAQALKAQGFTILFAFEEAIGFGPGDVVFEKDGLTSAALFCEMAVALREQEVADGESMSASTGPSLLRRRLQKLHKRYGEFAEDNGYMRCEDTEVVSSIFRRLRSDGTYRRSFGEYRVTGVRDLSEGHGYDSEMPGGRPSLPLVGGGAHFLTFNLGDEGVVATLRTSGTEPKIKFYLEMQGPPGVPYAEVSRRLSKVAEVFVDESLEPKRWGMKKVALT